MSGLPLYNIKSTEYADGSTETVIFEKAVSSQEKKKKNNVPPGMKKLPVPELTPFGEEALYVLTDDSLYTMYQDNQKLTEEQQKAKKERSKSESIKRSKKKVEILGRANKWKYFVTLTFNPIKIDSMDYTKVADAIKTWLNTMKHRYPSMQYLLVLEKHKKGGYHVHALISDCDLRLIDSKHKVRKTHQTIYNLIEKEYDLGFTTVTYVRDSGAASMYLSKYIGKALGEVPEHAKRYWASRGLKDENDVCIKYLFDTIEELQLAIQTILDVADKVRTIYNTHTKSHITYVKTFAHKDDSLACCPT